MHRANNLNNLLRQLCIFRHCKEVRRTPLFIGFCFFILLLLPALPGSSAVKGPSGVIRVGIFQFEPFNYTDENGFSKGLNPDLLQEIVSDEQWTVKYVPGTWAEGLARLQSGEIDLMMSVAYSSERSKVMDYTYESVAELWGQVFIPPASRIRNITDLAGRRVAVMRGDISAENFKKTASELGITCELVEFPSHHDVFQAVKDSNVSAGVTPQHFGLRHTDQYDLVASSIMFSPFSIFFTAKKGHNHELLSHINAHLAEWKREDKSFYYDRLNHWLGWRAPIVVLPTGLLVALVAVTLVAVVTSGFIFFLRRVVSRKTRELQKSEEKYRSMMESMVDPVYICSSGKSVTYMNPAMIQRIGRDATGEKCHKALHNLDKECSWCRFPETGTDGNYEIDVVSPLDNRSYHVSNSPMTLFDGSVQKLTVFRDTTAMKEIQSQLQRAQEIQAIGNLAGGIAHDFNNILCPIVGMSEMLMEDFVPGSLEYENAAAILKAGNRGSQLVQQILAFSRQSENKKIPIRIQAVIQEVLKLCRASIPSSIEIQHDIQLNSGLVMADSTQIHQVAMNLITNAFHAVEQNEGKVYIELKEITITKGGEIVGNLKPGKYQRLSVSDNGYGIPPEITDKIFDPYFTTKETGKGTGLGLATVLGIVKDHHGDIKVTSTPGEGAILDVYLPIMKPSQETVITPEKKIGNKGGTESILLVDDEEPIVLLQKKILERLGYRVTERVSSLEAFKAFEANPDKFDLVISDMTMPGMTGDKLAQRLLALKPNLPIIICTGYSDRINEESAGTLGIKGLIMKPVRKNDLVQMVRDVLDEA